MKFRSTHPNVVVRPNYLMLKLADQALDAKGRLLDLDSQLNASLSRMY